LNAPEETDVLPLGIDLRGQAQDNDSYGNQKALCDEPTSNGMHCGSTSDLWSSVTQFPHLPCQDADAQQLAAFAHK